MSMWVDGNVGNILHDLTWATSGVIDSLSSFVRQLIALFVQLRGPPDDLDIAPSFLPCYRKCCPS